MRNFYIKSVFFWFILLVLAILNGAVRDVFYKPILIPFLGKWAHQISSFTGIIIFFIAIYFFLKRIKDVYTKNDLIIIGFIWLVMTMIFEFLMNLFIQKLSLEQIIQTYYFWRGEMWPFVLISLIISPLIAHKIIKK